MRSEIEGQPFSTEESLHARTRNLSIDKQMIGTKSRVIIQYKPKKPKKFGIKLWALCESLTGYFFNFKFTLDSDAAEH